MLMKYILIVPFLYSILLTCKNSTRLTANTSIACSCISCSVGVGGLRGNNSSFPVKFNGL